MNDNACETAWKEKLFHMAKYKRKCLQLTNAEARDIISMRTVEFLGVFVNVADLYG